MKRELIKRLDNGDMVVLDEYRNGCFQAGLLTTELRPTTVFKRLSGFTDRAAALAAAAGQRPNEGGG